MGKVVFTMYASLDGYVEDSDGRFDYAEPDEELHRLANEQAREASAFAMGRGLYEVMEDFWSDPARRDGSELEAEFAAAYVATPRYVFSDSLEGVPEGVQLVRSADAEAVMKRLKEETDGPVDLGGPGLAASLRDSVDEYRLYLNPVVVGGGKPFFGTGRERLNLRLAEQRALSSGVVYLRYERA